MFLTTRHYAAHSRYWVWEALELKLKVPHSQLGGNARPGCMQVATCCATSCRRILGANLGTAQPISQAATILLL